MKFWSRYINVRYTVVPDDFEWNGRFRRKVPGLHAQFDNNQFDTEAQGWDDEARLLVEEHLQTHADYGKTLRAVSDDDMADMMANARPPSMNCLFTRTIDGQAWLCGRPATSDDGYCDEHADEIHTPQTKPNRRSEPAA